jgi:hypothetical protein
MTYRHGSAEDLDWEYLRGSQVWSVSEIAGVWIVALFLVGMAFA